MKKLIVTSSDDKFATGCAVLLYSLKKNMSIFDECDVKVFYTNLSEESRNLIKSVCPKVVFEKPKDFDYCKGIKTLYGEDNQDTYLCLESFRQTEYDKVAYIDTDMLCVGDISNLFHEQYKLGMMACLGKKQFYSKLTEHKNGIEKFNAGLMIIGKEHLEGEKTYKDLVSIVKKAKETKDDDVYKVLHKTSKTFNDQDAVRIYWTNRPVIILPDWYNFKLFGFYGKYEEHDKFFRDFLHMVKIIHYSGKRKPWANKTDRTRSLNDGAISGAYDVCSVGDPEEMNKSLAVHVWHDYYEECFGKKCINDWYKHDKTMSW